MMYRHLSRLLVVLACGFTVVAQTPPAGVLAQTPPPSGGNGPIVLTDGTRLIPAGDPYGNDPDQSAPLTGRVTVKGDGGPAFGTQNQSGVTTQIVRQQDPGSVGGNTPGNGTLANLEKQLVVGQETMAATQRQLLALQEAAMGGKKREDGLDVDPEGALIRSKLDSKTGKPRRPASQIARESGLVMIPAGTIITIRTITRVQTELGGTCLGVIDSDVLSAQYDAVAIPKGSKVLGAVQAVQGQAQDRAAIIFRQIVDLNGDQIQLLVPEPATDYIGQAGVTGNVNNHLGQQFGYALVWGLLSGLTGNGTPGALNPNSNFGDIVRQNTASSFGQVGQSYLQNAMNIKPDIEVAENTQMRIILGNPIYIKAWKTLRPF